MSICERSRVVGHYVVSIFDVLVFRSYTGRRDWRRKDDTRSHVTLSKFESTQILGRTAYVLSDIQLDGDTIKKKGIVTLHIESHAMAVFGSKKFRSAADANTIASRYRAALKNHPFALFGLPFIATMVAGSFFLTPATAIRYEKHDRRVKRLSKEEELGIGKNSRRVDMKEEYYVCLPLGAFGKVAHAGLETCCEGLRRLGTKTRQASSRRA